MHQTDIGFDADIQSDRPLALAWVLATQQAPTFSKRQRDAWADLSDSAVRDKGVEAILRKRPTFDSSEQLGRVLEMRQSEIAHRASVTTYDRGRPKFEDVDHCISWGKEFIGMVGKAFGKKAFKRDDGSFLSDSLVKSSVMSIRRLTHKAGIVVDAGLAETERLAATLLKD